MRLIPRRLHAADEMLKHILSLKLGMGVLTVTMLLFSLSAPVPAAGSTFYVAKSGQDANPCSQSQPCLTIGHALSVATSPGSVVQVGAGTYNENVTFNNSGTSGNPITLRGQNGSGCPTVAVADVNQPTGTHPNASAIIVGSVTFAANYTSLDCFHIETTGNGTISVNTQVTNGSITNSELDGNGSSTPGTGIWFAGIDSVPSSQYASSFTVTGNYVHGLSNGFFVVCNQCTFQNNEIESLWGDEPGSDHDYIDIWGINTTVRHNYMHNNTANSCMSYDCHMDCIQSWNTAGNGTEVAKNIVFDRNVCFNHHEGVIVQDNAGNGDVQNWTVTNNVFAYGPWDDGSGHLAVAGTVHPWCWIFEDGELGASNTFYNNTCISGSVGFRNASGTGSFKNDIYYNPPGGTIVYFNGGGTSTPGANDLYFTSGQSWSATYSGDVVNKDPLFVSLGTGSSVNRCLGCNFNIQAGSPAINAGTTVPVTTDLLGTTRPQGGAYDIGAYEYIGTTATAPAAPTNLHVTSNH